MTQQSPGETLLQRETISKSELLRLKALLMGREGMVARSYVIEKIDRVLSKCPIPLDERNECTYRELVGDKG